MSALTWSLRISFEYRDYFEHHQSKARVNNKWLWPMLERPLEISRYILVRWDSSENAVRKGAAVTHGQALREHFAGAHPWWMHGFARKVVKACESVRQQNCANYMQLASVGAGVFSTKGWKRRRWLLRMQKFKKRLVGSRCGRVLLRGVLRPHEFQKQWYHQTQHESSEIDIASNDSEARQDAGLLAEVFTQGWCRLKLQFLIGSHSM